MILVVSPRLEQGVERGGEDLYLEIECVGEATEFEQLGENTEFVVEPENGDIDWELELDDETGEVVNFSCESYRHGFSWSGTKDDVRELALGLGLLDKSTWSWCGKALEPPKFRWKDLSFVDGNAD